MTSKIHILSDLHLEFDDFSPPETDADIVILAGDIHTGSDGLSWARKAFPDKEIIYVSGNHEFYHHLYDQLLAEFRWQAEAQQIHFLENRQCVLNGIRFLGCTLWTDYNCYVEHSQEQSMQLLGNSLADHKLIKKDLKGRLFSPEDALKLHEKSLDWLSYELNQPFPGKTVVISHHGPSLDCKHRIYGHSDLAPGFYSDLSYLLDKSDYWIYGHTHSNLNIQHNQTHLIANQRGYPNEEIKGFEPGLVITI